MRIHEEGFWCWCFGHVPGGGLEGALERLNGFNLRDRRVFFRNSLSGGWVSRIRLSYSPSVGAVNILVEQ